MFRRVILWALACLALVCALSASAVAEGAGYTVEFGYEGLEYVLPGGTSVSMSEILSALGLTGEAEAVSVSNPDLFSASRESGAWIVTAHRAFRTTEWMKVVLNGVTREIAVTDALSVSYIHRSWDDENKKVEETGKTVSATEVTASTVTWGTAGNESWYVAISDVTMTDRIKVSGTVNLILCDDITLKALKGITVTGSNTLNIYGQSGDTGMLNASNNVSDKNLYGAGIGGYNGTAAACGTVNIYGGKVIALGSSTAAGIGGGPYGSGGTIGIYGGNVSSYAGSNGNGGAGIGSGLTKNQTNQNTDTTIVIMGNAVVDAAGYGGAGIGSGLGYPSTSGGAYHITIGGNANVTARSSLRGSGGGSGAGIGGGSCSRGGTITISGGTVKATGSYGGAGIGSGYNGKNTTTITIEGGKVTATGSKYGTYHSASIGNGYMDDKVNTINLNGGYITAETYGIGYFKSNVNYPFINISLRDPADAIINAENYYGRVTIDPFYPLQNVKTGRRVDQSSMPAGPSELILMNAPRYQITGYSDSFGNSVTSSLNGVPYSNPLAGDMIDIDVTPGAGYRCVENSVTVTAENGTPVQVVNHRFQMPEQNVTLSAQFTRIPITYIAPDGTTQSNITDYTPITSELTTLTGGTSTPRVYAVLGDVEILSRIYVENNVILVLTDGAVLKAHKGILVPGGQTLSICGNSTEEDVMGALTIDNTDKNKAGIGGDGFNQCGTINICGGKINAKGNSAAGIGGGYERHGGTVSISGGIVTASSEFGGAGIGGGGGLSNLGSSSSGNITISGGTVTATGSDGGAGIGDGSGVYSYNQNCTITISGGTVTANGSAKSTGTGGGAGIGGGSGTEGGTINISGGNIEATGGGNATGIGNGYGNTGASSLTVDFSGSNDSLKASSYTALTVNTGKYLTDSEGAFYTGTLSADQRTAVQGKTLVLAYGITVTVSGEGGTVTPSAIAAPKNGRVTLSVSPADGYELESLSYRVAGSSESVNIVKGSDGKYSFQMPEGNVAVTATFALHQHHFTYTAQGSTITAQCTEGCSITTGLTLTISASANLTYNGQSKAAVLNTDYSTVAFPGPHPIVYTRGGAAFDGTPTDAGEYTASVTVGEGNGAAAASVAYTIAKAAGSIAYAEGTLTRTFGDAAFIHELTHTGDGTVSYASSRPGVAEVDSETGEVTIAGAGEATITAAVTDSSNYTYAVRTASYTLTVRPATMTVRAEGYTGTYDGKPHSITVTVANPANGAVITYGTTEGTYNLTANPEITNVPDSRTVYFKVTAANYTPVTGSAAVTLSKADPAAPAAPTLAGATVSSITLTAIPNGQYRLGDGEWKDSPIFGGLAMNTEYTFCQRLKEDANHNASPTSPAARLSTSDHVHEWSYEAQGDVLRATCRNTDGGHGMPLTSELTISAPTLTTYGETGRDAHASITGSIDGVTNPPVVYRKGGVTLDSAPTDAGTYTAGISLGGVTASVTYTIAPAALTGVSAAQNGSLTYTGQAQTPQVTTTATSVNSQTVTFLYSRTQNGEYSSAVPMVTNVADCGIFYYKATAPNHADAAGSFTVTMNRAGQDAPAAPTLAGATVSSITLTAIPNGQYRLGDGEWKDSPIFGGLAMNTGYTFCQRLKEDANRNASPPSPAARLSTSNHVHEWSYEAQGAVLRAKCRNTDGGHGTPLTSELTISAPTLTTYGETGRDAHATIIGGIDGVTNPPVVYRKGGVTLDSAPTDAGTYTAGITLGGVTASVEYTIAQAATAITEKPAAGEITYGQTLAGSPLTGGRASVAGTFAWKDAAVIPGVSDSQRTEYTVVFTPADANYATAECRVTLTVNMADNPMTYAAEQTVNLTFSTSSQTAALEAAENGAGAVSYGILSQKKGEETVSCFTLDGTALTVASNTPAGTYTLVVSARAAGSGNYKNVSRESTVTVTIHKAAPAVVTAPAARTLTYTGSAQKLVEAGSADAGTLYYAVTTENQAPADDLYSTSIPEGTHAGTYHVWYKVMGDPNHLDSQAECVTVNIRKREAKGNAFGDAVFAGLSGTGIQGVDIEGIRKQMAELAAPAPSSPSANQVRDVTVAMNVTVLAFQNVPESEKNAIRAAANGIYLSSGGDPRYDCMEITVEKNVTIRDVDENGVKTEAQTLITRLTETKKVIDIPVYFSLTEGQIPAVARYHNGSAQVFTRLNTRPGPSSLADGTFYVEGSGKDTVIHIYANRFSLYAILTYPEGTEKKNGFYPEVMESSGDQALFDAAAIPGNSFSFTKEWHGGREDSISFTLCRQDGTVYHHGFDKRVVNSREWRYEAWFSEPVACYVIEEPIPGYSIQYENVGVYKLITDRCCDGGTIVNRKIPKTGDDDNPVLWTVTALSGMAGTLAILMVRRRRRSDG